VPTTYLKRKSYMKKLLTGIALAGLTLAAVGQGSVAVDNQTAVGGIALDTPGNYYTGKYGLEIWAKTGAIGANINSFNGVYGGVVTAYANLAADGYVLAATFANKTMSAPGYLINVGTATAANVSPGMNAVAVVAWTGSAASFNAAIYGSARAGVYTFRNGFYTVPSPPTLLGDGWGSTDLIMGSPEPSTFALAGLGAAMFVGLRRRK
jgi:PEP-CTERM motif